MSAPAGNRNNPNGRPVGTVNKATKQAREAIAAFVDNNAERLNGWLDAIAEKDPKAAFDAFMSVVEYHIPKLARNDVNVAIKEMPQARVYPLGVDEQHRLSPPPETVDGVYKHCD